MKAPTVSVLTTVYNRAHFLADCIDSVLGGHFQDFELIIIDDQSTDGSFEIATQYAEKDSRIKVHLNPVNLGDYPNRNKAASLARGKYIKYLDADDMLGKFAIDIMVDAIERFPSAGFALFDFGPNRPLKPILLQPDEIFTAHYSGQHDFLHRSPLSAIINRKAFSEAGGFKPEPYTSDFELWHRLGAQHAMVMMSPWPLFWREHAHQQSEVIRTDATIPMKYLLLTEDFLCETSSPLQPEQRLSLLKSQKKKIARTVLYSLKTRGAKTMLRLKRQTNRSWVTLMRDAFS